MKIVEAEQNAPTLEEVMQMAAHELVVIRQPDGKTFAISAVDDADVEAELLKNDLEFMAFMQALSQEETVMSSHQLRDALGL